MPYPVVHVLFFIFCVSGVAVYATIRSIFSREISLRDSKNILLLLFVGSLCSLFPDIVVVYNLLINGTFEHCRIGSIPTHSFLFSSTAILFGTLAGYLAYRRLDRAMYLGLFAEAAFLIHLLLDDASERGCEYLYPLYEGKISIFSLMDVSFQNSSFFMYIIKSFVSVFFIFFIVMIVLFALNQFSFEFNYKSKKY